jgi:hypothetical protein
MLCLHCERRPAETRLLTPGFWLLAPKLITAHYRRAGSFHFSL